MAKTEKEKKVMLNILLNGTEQQVLEYVALDMEADKIKNQLETVDNKIQKINKNLKV